ncbi:MULTISPECIES: glutaredoxin family protein [unclassified Herbaspirillum]|uniref:glutaredoxin family protein n=1 Tax=unclassified Herbaspirillum TaxID=2624150 RepID=UPI00383AAFB6
MSSAHFILYSRSYCHLCEDMLLALEKFRPVHEFTVEIIDVDADEALVQRYDELVPVLVGQRQGQPPVQLCHYFLDVAGVEKFLL